MGIREAISSAEKKKADFGNLNNIATSAFTFLIYRTKKFLVTYYKSCKIKRPSNLSVVSHSVKKVH